MQLRLFISVAAFAMLTVTACQTANTGSKMRSTDASPDSQICGGIANLQCPRGYHCSGQSDQPDAAGSCVQRPEPKAAKACGGIGNLQCAAGYTCVGATSDDVLGTCQTSRNAATDCGGTQSLQCDSGYTCVGATGNDGTGQCQPIATGRPLAK